MEIQDQPGEKVHKTLSQPIKNNLKFFFQAEHGGMCLSSQLCGKHN
jgi:hypothetical protein